MSTFSRKISQVIFCLLICIISLMFVINNKHFVDCKEKIKELDEKIAEIEAENKINNAEINDEINKIRSQINNVYAEIEEINIANEDNEIEPMTMDETESAEEPVFYLSEYERRVAECMVMGESGGEPYDGQILVAQCILNACLKNGFQPSEVRKSYGYSGWNENVSDSVKDAVSAVFDRGYKVTDEYILYFYAPAYATSSWHESLNFVTELGGHRFFSLPND